MKNGWAKPLESEREGLKHKINDKSYVLQKQEKRKKSEIKQKKGEKSKLDEYRR
jgi:hypothetical protein